MAAAVVGMVLLIWQGVFRDQPSIPVMVVGLACLGVLATGVLQKWLIGMSGGRNGSDSGGKQG